MKNTPFKVLKHKQNYREYGGSNAKCIRTVMKAAGNLAGKKVIVDIAEFWVFTKSTIRGIILGDTEALNRYRETGKFFSYKTSEPEQ